jgi:hypothetical protein
MTALDNKLSTLPATLNLAAMDSEIENLSRQIDAERDERRKAWLCAAYQALRWARNPDGYAAPSGCEPPEPRLRMIANNGAAA